MKRYLHRVLGLYETIGAAEIARERLVRLGLRASQLTMLQPGIDGRNQEVLADSDDVLYEMLSVGASGALIGMLVGVAGAVALSLADTNLLGSGPVLGTLIMIGWGISIGGFVGALVGARRNKAGVADLLKISLASGHVVLVAHADTEEQTTSAQLILGPSITNTTVGRALP